MHAASVYPEPGSNSLNMIYQGCRDATIIPSLSALLTLKSSLFFKFKRIFGVFYILSLLFNFQGASLSPVWVTALLLYQNRFPLSIPFFKFFQSFFARLSSRYLPFAPAVLPLLAFVYSVFTAALADSFVIISAHIPIVNYFFHLFLRSVF